MPIQLALHKKRLGERRLNSFLCWECQGCKTRHLEENERRNYYCLASSLKYD